MTDEEQKADLLLMAAKDAIRQACYVLEPNVTHPVAMPMLAAMDAIDQARKVLAQRGP